MRTVRYWHRLPRDVVDAPSLESKGQAGGALSTDGAVGVPVHCREWDLMAFRGPFQFKPFCDGSVSTDLGSDSRMLSRHGFPMPSS